MNDSIIKKAIVGNSKLTFIPNKTFYEEIGIKSKRWGMLFDGKIEPSISEVEKVAVYFKIPYKNFFTNPNLFD